MHAAIEDLDLRYEDAGTVLLDGGVELYHERYGADGPPVTIVNNYFLISPLWRNFTHELARGNRILTYDLRNQGASSPAEAELRIADHVEDLRRLLDALDVADTYLVGTSISTLICRDFAVAYPELVRGLVLVGPVFNPFGSARRKYLTRSWLKTLELGGPSALFAQIYPLVFGDGTVEHGGAATYLALRERFLALNSHEQLRINLNASLTTEDDPAQLRRIEAPTLLLAGDGDFLSSRSSLDVARALLPRGRMEILPFAGHVPYFEATSAFEGAVQAFIDELEREAGS